MLIADKMLRVRNSTAVSTGNVVLADGKSREKVAADYWDSFSRRQKGKERGRILGEHWNMKRGDRESKIYMTIDVMHEQLLRYHSQELAVEIPVAAFMCGQSVL